ncbi:MAG: TetR/AcrR family transcriptional regulator [Phyllobacteriaceae bacterium]|nr:TetR/AcrR family transcriptional regulator [Phyllobacteriaceae bacterium]
MARTLGSVGEKTFEAIRAAGTRLIWRHGFEAMSLRRLAAEVGVQPGSLYNHFETKQALLFDIVRSHMETLTTRLDEALVGHVAPRDRLIAFAAFHSSYHMTRRMQVYVANSELRSLDPENRAAVVDLRRAYERRLEEILRAGRDAGLFRVDDLKITTFALISMMTGICEWYRPEGRLSEAELVRLHVDMVLRAVGA